MGPWPQFCHSPAVFLQIVLVLCWWPVARTAAIVLLQDLSTPSFLIDLQAVQKVLGPIGQVPIPPICLPNSSMQLAPRRTDRKLKDTPCPHTFDVDLEAIDLFGENEDDRSSSSFSTNASGDVCYGYIHSRVVRSRQEKRDDDPATFLAEIDASDSCDAHLVLGLNNHHVVSYYWARSAGAGAAMETPGILFDNGILRWESNTGFEDCNSNDGKRSEWVNFLRPGDNVQLRPHDPEAALATYSTSGIYGISAAGRPLGSEPVVVCDWKPKLADERSDV